MWVLPRRERSLCTLTGKGMSFETWNHLAESSANARKNVVDGTDISNSRTRRGQIAKSVKAPRWSCVERAWPFIRTLTAATHDVVSVTSSCCNGWFTSTSIFGSSTLISGSVMISHYSCSSRRRYDTTFELQQYKISSTVIKQGKGSWAQMKANTKNRNQTPTIDRRRWRQNTVLRCLKSRAKGYQGVYEEGIGISGWNLFNLIIDATHYLRDREHRYECWVGEI